MCTRTVSREQWWKGVIRPARVVLSTSTRVELEGLEQWALRHTSTEDTLVLEASGNAFAVAARLRAIGREVEILDSHHAGKVGKVYAPTIESMR